MANKIKNFYQGTTRRYSINVLIEDELGEQSIVSVDGAILLVTFKSDVYMEDEDAEIYKRQVCAEVDPSNPTGKIEISLSKEDTAVPPGKYYYYFQILFPNGTLYTILPDVNAEKADKIVHIKKRVRNEAV